MKKVLISVVIFSISIRGFNQSEEVQQLLLNWEKLTQFRAILDEMYKGYQVIHNGYSAIKDISEGNFSLHKSFLDGLMEVSPAVKKYYKVADIISCQLRIVKLSKLAFNQFKADKGFTSTEIEYMGKVYTNLLKQSLNSLDELLLVITAGKLRMSDDERLAAIDRIYNDISGQFSFLKEFNNGGAVLAAQRNKEMLETELSRKLYNVR